MITPLRAGNLECLKNPVFRAYAQTYVDIAQEFEQTVESFGLPFSKEPRIDLENDLARSELEARGITVENDGKSLLTDWISPSCLTCRKGIGTVTFLTSTQCPRHCFFCFNPNQVDYDYYLHHTHDLIAELDDLANRGIHCCDLALTGGEPLMHKGATIAFFEHAAALYPDAYTRLYTSGTGLDRALLEELRAAGLNEIRFSVKSDDSAAERARTLHLIEESKNFIDAVMVEMPVMPDERAFMEKLLCDLDEICIDGINLLELCFPFHNASEFARRGYRIKARPFRVLYDYWYAGGLPIAGSEEACLDLLEFAREKQLGLGVHYCSLENKLSGQIYQQNAPYRTTFPYCTLSERDYFLKSAKAFGADARTVRDVLERAGQSTWRYDEQGDYLIFPVSWITRLADSFPNMEMGICYYVVEQRDGEEQLRELRIDATSPANFDPAADV